MKKGLRSEVAEITLEPNIEAKTNHSISTWSAGCLYKTNFPTIKKASVKFAAKLVIALKPQFMVKGNGGLKMNITSKTRFYKLPAARFSQKKVITFFQKTENHKTFQNFY